MKDSGVAEEGEQVWVCINILCPDIGNEKVAKEQPDCDTCHEPMVWVGPAL